jgi:hypothetical protein
MIEKEFEALRHMESFTEDMFNRIIAFQEKQHPAWNPALPFNERIKGLPLHYLIFSNADRDPAKFGPTVTNYYPMRQEMQKLAYYIQQSTENARVCDLYCGNGFIGSLLARELPQGNIPVTGLRAYNAKANQIDSFFDADCYQFSDANLDACECDVVFTSWIPAGINPTAAIVAKQPKLIIYVYTKHKHPETGERQSGTDDMFDDLDEAYQLIQQWSITRPENLFHEIWPDLTPNIEETRYTRIYASKQLPEIKPPKSLPQATPYDWEQELTMAQLALKAKQAIQARGFMV